MSTLANQHIIKPTDPYQYNHESKVSIQILPDNSEEQQSLAQLFGCVRVVLEQSSEPSVKSPKKSQVRPAAPKSSDNSGEKDRRKSLVE